jgi:hypothetical protein
MGLVSRERRYAIPLAPVYDLLASVAGSSAVHGDHVESHFFPPLYVAGG